LLNLGDDPFEFSMNGKSFITWNFNSLEVDQFRNMKFDQFVGNHSINRILPRYINQINSFDFKLNTVDIMYYSSLGPQSKNFTTCLTSLNHEVYLNLESKFFIQMAVFERVSDLEEKLEIVICCLLLDHERKV
jgi:hypothetical protein